jgi:hypothetical protein
MIPQSGRIPTAGSIRHATVWALFIAPASLIEWGSADVTGYFREFDPLSARQVPAVQLH